MTTTHRPTPVPVTGIGAITSLGLGAEATWQAVLAGTSGVRQLNDPWATDLPVRIGAPVTAELPLERKEARHMDRCSQFGVVAGREAWQDAGFEGAAGTESCALDPRRVAAVVGVGVGGLDTTLDQYNVLSGKGARAISPYSVTMLIPSGPAGHVGLDIGARGGVHTVVSACASGSEAVLRGAQLIHAGDADVVLVVGTEAAMVPLTIAGFAAMRALSTRNEDPTAASRPFDAERDGFVLGEGGAALVLEHPDHARARGAQPRAHFLAGITTSDSHHVAQPAPEAREAARAISLSLHRAGVDRDDVTHVNAHATGTPAGDLAEARAYRDSLQASADRVAVSATKSITGHLLGAAGALEALLTVRALQERTAPATLNVDTLDDGVELDVVRDRPRPLPPGPSAAVSSSFGFGGHNVALVFGAEQETG
ncbi:beta-ketoacyl-[acyl-carrier-protein] synthase family protein [Streptomyces monticola]|uniref:Beta-ketoacyl-[acyl-carrier-protein] synthase family protein n=1 Tax=Streptomyces monticola TaxID=2666263 RepID=A0ABW2JPI1_9ACTN